MTLPVNELIQYKILKEKSCGALKALLENIDLCGGFMTNNWNKITFYILGAYLPPKGLIRVEVQMVTTRS